MSFVNEAATIITTKNIFCQRETLLHKKGAFWPGQKIPDNVHCHRLFVTPRRGEPSSRR